ncbi:hypothetical protein DL764_005386 [Monosporascus ibericus]|uniref:dual-specificity kinase n=1 Tax=Monosporascus ibericus TaxID=155417 RepID=A0A4Q4TD52_9PEZI|nr:hypothetical protein DL764_005386 [Monosporascus ibericus]
MLHASSSNNHSLFSFGRNGSSSGIGDSASSFEFLPSVNFDDLHSSLESASTEFKLTQFPLPTGQGSILGQDLATDSMSGQQSTVTHNVGTTRASAKSNPASHTAARSTRTGSVLRRPSISSRKPSVESDVAVSANMDPPTAPPAMRPRRQGQYPPVSNSNIAKAPRKSIGPGVIDGGDYGSRGPQKRRPSASSNVNDRAGDESFRASVEFLSGSTGESTGTLTTSRSTKARSVQPPPRISANFCAGSGSNSTLTAEQHRASNVFSKSPKGKGSTTPSARRMSVMPGSHGAHATGLGARTISPTDAQRMKRSLQRAFIQGGANSSRLPAPKSMNIHNAPPTEEEEDVPPVPAIPKAYESPRDAPTEISFLDKIKSSHGASTTSLNSDSTGTLSNTSALEPAAKVQRKASARKKLSRRTLGGPSADAEQLDNANPAKNDLPPLRLPPINLGPLSTPTAARIAALQDHGNDNGTASPLPTRILAKTPTTPMTASKSTFFSRGRPDRDVEKTVRRSTSSHHIARIGNPTPVQPTSSSESLVGTPSKSKTRKQNVSPFLSSSLPKDGDDFGTQLTKAKAKRDVSSTITVDTAAEGRPHQKPSGPRAQKATKSAPKSPPPPGSEMTPEEPQTPSSMSTLRRKLSLSWKRSNSKVSHHAHSLSDKSGGQYTRQESMPPPRLPISAAPSLNSLKASSPSHPTKSSGTYLESKRRKSSASSLTAVAHDKNRSDGLANTKKDVGNSSTVEAASQPRKTSSMQRILRPRPSAASVQQNEAYTAELDKDDLAAEDEMKRLASRRKETEIAARTLDALRKRATCKERVSPHEAIRIASLNIYERGEIIDYNDVYFCGTQNANKVVGDLHSSSPNFGYDDERGDYTIVIGDHLAYRYEVIDVLGKGSFGQVVRCIDHKSGALVAVKIIRNKKRFHQQALVEVNILQKLREWDPKNKHSMVNFTHSFYFRGHLCISTELLDMNLYEFIKSNSFRGFSLKLIRRFTKQMLSSLNLLKQHKVIHCDLKPENILLRHPMHSEIKVIDFGSSCFENEKVYTYIQSRFYRSPEVILGMTYGLPIDMWSVGCILAELYTGVPIFPGENEQEQLACIMEVFGPPEKHLIEKSTRKKLFFDSMGKPRLTVSSKGRRRRPSSKTLQQVLKCDDEPFLDFLSRCLRWDPDRRLKPEDAIRHEFITGQKTSVPAARLPGRESPMKRHNTISAPRPLPEPPSAVKAGSGLRPRDTTTGSPLKPFSGTTGTTGARRASGMNGPGTILGSKRTSGGTNATSSTAPAANSSLPRVAGRSVSAKQDLASAGANVAMSRRA